MAIGVFVKIYKCMIQKDIFMEPLIKYEKKTMEGGAWQEKITIIIASWHKYTDLCNPIY